MSTDPASIPDTLQLRTDEVPVVGGSGGGGAPHYPDSIDPTLIDQTKNQIRSLVQEITDLARSQCSEEEFYQGFLTRTTSALASVGGVIWKRKNEDSPLQLLYHINLTQTVLANDPNSQVRHSRLLDQLLKNPEPTLIAPHSGGADEDQPGNPTQFLLIFCPLRIDSQVIGFVEILQRPGGGPATQRGYLRFLAQMCDIASDFLKTKRLRAFNEQQQLWSELDRFSRAIHESLETLPTAYAIANDGRRIVGCDRLSVVSADKSSARVIAVSGLDTIERRADQTKRLGQLARVVLRTREPLWFEGDSAELAPQIEAQLHAYLDVAHSKFIGIIPLFNDPDESKRSRRVIGALILEQLTDSRLLGNTRNRARVVAEHAQTALGNCLEHQGLFLMPLWKQLGKLTRPFQGERRAKTFILLGAIAALFVALFVVPYPFSLGTTGELIAEKQQEIFAEIDGKFSEILVPEDPQHVVEAGALLAVMTNSDLSREIERLRGDIAQLQEIIESLRRQQANFGNRIDDYEKLKIIVDLDKAKQELSYKEKELASREADFQKLRVVSPIRGSVVNWQVRRQLQGRPVRQGQNLMTIVAPDTTWQLSLYVPEKRVGHLLRAQTDSATPLNVTFTLASHPGSQFQGQIAEIDPILDIHDGQENSARVLINFENQQISPELLRSGTRVTAKVECGTRALGYVLFHELYESAKTSMLYWF
jgi:multidrug efflux pump subunit AcrA (membrane-fusion protein)